MNPAAHNTNVTLLAEGRDYVVVNKPAPLKIHPNAPDGKPTLWGELCGLLAYEIANGGQVSIVNRLDRETSGVVVLAKDAAMASRLQTAMMERKAGKGYLAVLTGELTGKVTVDQPLGDDLASPVFIKSAVVTGGQAAVTHFTPLAVAKGFTAVRVVTETGRKHQIRAHAQWLGHSLVGDKIYGPDARHYIDFITKGWTAEMAEKLLLPRQALHCAEIDLRVVGAPEVFRAELAPDIRTFCQDHGLVWRRP